MDCCRIQRGLGLPSKRAAGSDRPADYCANLLRESSELYAKGEKERLIKIRSKPISSIWKTTWMKWPRCWQAPIPFGGYYAFINSALIILREGLEVALILPTILTMLRAMGATQAIRYIHLGDSGADRWRALTWIATQTVLSLSGQHRESMEGSSPFSPRSSCSMSDTGSILGRKPKNGKHSSEKESRMWTTKRIFALVAISSLRRLSRSVRSGVVYQALWLQNESNHGAVIWGFLTGLAALVVVIFAILKLGLHLPLKYFFGATGTLLYIMAFVFAGNGIKELQAARWLPSTALSFPPQVPLWESIPLWKRWRLKL